VIPAFRLRSVPLFAGLDDAALERIAATAKACDFEAGTVLIAPDHKGAGLFVIDDGTVTIELRGRTRELGHGEVVGELSLLTPDGTRTARVRAKTRVRGLAIDRADFTSVLLAEPGIAVALLEVLARRLAAQEP
jgi:CPA1 family monovalent cation:H+ antiporter